ncbi:DUF6192 family protein [Streptomyces sp. NPDC006510]|uniref:DUF6192 family protein n=1 Tax=Streptomyces sp. NPDC006510 TaxID=3155600 RepID=UPI0033B08DBF
MVARDSWTASPPTQSQQVDRPMTVEEKVRAVRDLTRDHEVAVKVTAGPAGGHHVEAGAYPFLLVTAASSGPGPSGAAAAGSDPY